MTIVTCLFALFSYCLDSRSRDGLGRGRVRRGRGCPFPGRVEGTAGSDSEAAGGGGGCPWELIDWESGHPPQGEGTALYISIRSIIRGCPLPWCCY